MHRYESYKLSDIDWVGEIPSHWEIVKPKYKLNRVTRPIDDEDDVITCFRDGVVTLRKNRRKDGFTNSIKEHGYQQIHPGDLVVHEMDGFAGAIGISDSKGKSTPVYTVVKPDHQTDLKYIAYLLREMSQTGKIESLARSIRERTTDFRWNMWSVIHFPFPPVKEQKLISQYLDKKTKQIDNLIEKIQKKIELLKEERTSFINHCVTKGLDPNVEMKDSGVEWIGKIPGHWEIIKTNLVSDNLDGKRVPLNAVERDSRKGDIPYWGSNGIVDYVNDYMFDEKLVLVGEDGSPFFDSNKPVSFVTTGKVWINNHIHALRTKRKIIPEWLSESFNIVGYKEFITGSTRDKLTQTDLNRIPHVVPPINEQRVICSKILKRKESINKLIQLETSHIQNYREYRQSLVSSVVTGKVRIKEEMI